MENQDIQQEVQAIMPEQEDKAPREAVQTKLVREAMVSPKRIGGKKIGGSLKSAPRAVALPFFESAEEYDWEEFAIIQDAVVILKVIETEEQPATYTDLSGLLCSRKIGLEKVAAFRNAYKDNESYTVETKKHFDLIANVIEDDYYGESHELYELLSSMRARLMLIL